MNIKFENRFFGTDKMISEYVHKVICKKQKMPWILVSVLSFIALIITLYEKEYVLSVVMVACLVGSFFVVFLIPMLTVRLLKESGKRIHNGKDVETIIKFGDNISMSEGTLNLTIEYSQIQKIYSLKYVYVLMFGKTTLLAQSILQ